MEFKIQEIVGKKSSFKLSQLDDQEIFLEPATAGRLLKITKSLGEVGYLIGTPSSENLSKLCMYLLAPESMGHLKKREVKLIDLEGNETNEFIGGSQLLLSLINGVEEQMDIYTSILISLGWKKEDSIKLVQEHKDMINGKVKEMVEQDEKKKARYLDGMKSSTISQVNTDGQQNAS